MWKVENKCNYNKLIVFEENVIIPFFEKIIDCKKSSNSFNFLEYLNNNRQNKYYEILNYICKRKYKNIKFIDQVNLLLNSSIENLKKYYEIYKEQNNKIKKGNLDIKLVDVSEPLKIIFKDFFYESFFNNETLWKKYMDNEPFSRKKFHENFKKENAIYVCPYCDIDTLNNIGNKQVEHFFPKSKYPFLSMNGLNLISSCYSCNLPSEGKGIKNIKLPISMPYIKQIGDYINFDIDIGTKKVVLTTEYDEIKNYIKLLNLDKRYNNVRENLEHMGNGLYESILNYENKMNCILTSDKLENFIIKAKENDKKHLPFFFALKSLYSNYDNYKNKYKKLKNNSNK